MIPRAVQDAGDQSLLVTGSNPGAAVGVEAGMPPRHDELDNLLRDLPFSQSIFRTPCQQSLHWTRANPLSRMPQSR